MADTTTGLSHVSERTLLRFRGMCGFVRRALGRLGLGSRGSDIVLALNSVPHGFCIYDEDDRLVFANEGFSRIYRQPGDTLSRGMRFVDVLRGSISIGNYPGRTAEEIWSERKIFIDRRERGTFLQSLGDGRLIAISHQPLANGGWAAVYEDITERRRAETHLRFMAHHDPLTMLPNRLLFGQQLEAAVNDLPEGQSCSLICLDLDHFKPVNDLLGHAAGDELLRQFAERLRGELGERNVAARLGGDEFAVLLPIDGREVAREIAVRLRHVLTQPYDLRAAKPVRIGVSLGTAFAPEQATTSHALLKAADEALYDAKRRGRRGREAA